MTKQTDLIESGTGTLAGSSIDRDNRVIRNTVLINAISANGGGRTYTPKALQQIATMAEGLPAFANHVADKAMAFKPRDIREAIGRHRNVQFDPVRRRVTSDLHVLPHHEWVLNVAESLGDLMGNSLVSRGLVRVDHTGKEFVEDVVAVRSGDFVTDPATTRGLFEHREETPMTVTQKARQAIAAHALGQRYGTFKEAVSDTLVNTLIEAGEARWPALLDERVTVLDNIMKPGTRPAITTTTEGDLMEQKHARLAAALTGHRWHDYTAGPTPRELAEAADREQGRQPVTIPGGAHTLLREAITGERATSDLPLDAHAQLRRALGVGR